MKKQRRQQDTRPRAEQPTPTAAPEAPPRLHVAARYFVPRLDDDVVQAFLHIERLRGSTRKLSAADWDAELSTFARAPR